MEFVTQKIHAARAIWIVHNLVPITYVQEILNVMEGELVTREYVLAMGVGQDLLATCKVLLFIIFFFEVLLY